MFDDQGESSESRDPGRSQTSTSLLALVVSIHEELDLAEDASLRLSEELAELSVHLKHAAKETDFLRSPESRANRLRFRGDLSTASRWVEVFAAQASAESLILRSSIQSARSLIEGLPALASQRGAVKSFELLRGTTVRIGRSVLTSKQEVDELAGRLDSLLSPRKDLEEVRNTGLWALAALASTLEELLKTDQENAEILDALLGETRSSKKRARRWTTSRSGPEIRSKGPNQG